MVLQFGNLEHIALAQKGYDYGSGKLSLDIEVKELDTHMSASFPCAGGCRKVHFFTIKYNDYKKKKVKPSTWQKRLSSEIKLKLINQVFRCSCGGRHKFNFSKFTVKKLL